MKLFNVVNMPLVGHTTLLFIMFTYVKMQLKYGNTVLTAVKMQLKYGTTVLTAVKISNYE